MPTFIGRDKMCGNCKHYDVTYRWCKLTLIATVKFFGCGRFEPKEEEREAECILQEYRELMQDE